MSKHIKTNITEQTVETITTKTLKDKTLNV